jgi:hypothetical protein
MNYLEIVQEAMKRASVREDSPTTLVGATGIVEDFKGYVGDTYRHIQNTGHSERWFFRQSLDNTLSLTVDVDEYAMPAGLQSINWRTVSVYLTPKEQESMVTYLDYYHWRMVIDTRDLAASIPQRITQRPDEVLQISPKPDQAYTLRFDGIKDIHEMTGDTDEPLIPERFQWVLVYGAVKRFAKRHEDGSLLADADDEYRPIYDAMSQFQLPDVGVQTGHLYSISDRASRTRRW